MREPETKSSVTNVLLGNSLALFSGRGGEGTSSDAEALARAAGKALGERIGAPLPVLYAQQIHGATSFVYAPHDPLTAGPHLVGKCDALITAEPCVGLVVRTADCLPVALAGGGVAAMVHAGWRGLAADILGGVVRRFSVEFGVPARSLEAVVGVGIGACHYEVGPEVRAALRKLPGVGEAWQKGSAVDLQALAVARLEALGVPTPGVAFLPGCTYCDGAHHSYRRDGETSGRQWSAITLLGQRPAR